MLKKVFRESREPKFWTSARPSVGQSKKICPNADPSDALRRSTIRYGQIRRRFPSLSSPVRSYDRRRHPFQQNGTCPSTSL
jgi:hypothetical protein